MSKKKKMKVPGWLSKYFTEHYDGTFTEFLQDWKWIFSFSKRYKGIIVFYTLLGLFSSSLSLVSSYISKEIINIITEKQTDKLWMLVAVLVGSTVFSLVFSSIMSRVNTKISIYVNNDIQGEIFEKIMDAQWKELGQYSNGDLLQRFNGDVSAISGNAISWIPNIIINIFTFIVTFVVLFRMNIIMAVLALASAPFLLIMSRFIMRKMKEYKKKVLEMNSQMMAFEVDTFYNYDSIKSFGAIPHYNRELRRWQRRWKDYNLDYNAFEIKTNIWLTLVSTLVSGAAFGYCVYLLWNGQILYGDMTFFLQQRSSLSSLFSGLVSTFPAMLTSAISAHRVHELVSLPKEAHSEESIKSLPALKEEQLTIRLKDASFAYTDNKNVYEHAEFVARPNEIVAVLGESGGGKTTLFRLLLGLIYPDEGAVELTDSCGNNYNMNADLRQLVSYVPQGNSSILGTIAENLRVVKGKATDEEIIESLKKAYAWDFVEKLGINSPLGDRGKGISEGQAQRIAIARAILRDAPILMLDEATSALDETTENLVLDSILANCPGKTVIIATHRPSVLSRCDRIYRIENKKIVKIGGKEEE